MDKYEYKLRSEEIKELIKERDFVKAVEIADTIDWTRVRSVNMLCTISDLYKINRRYKEAKELLIQAYDKNPGRRQILYSLCELCIKTDDVIGAVEYYKEYVQLAPMDSGKFILQYKIYEAQDVSLEERIAVLEELKKRDYREKWGYELAYLYHRIGLGTKCVEECDELILWFREGKYIKKAMELKMLHQQLSEDQEILYKRMLPVKEQVQYEQQTKVFESTESQEQPMVDLSAETVDIHVKTVDVSQYNTLNLQKELAESMKEVLVADNGFAPLYDENASMDVLAEDAMVEISAVPVEVEVTTDIYVPEELVEDVSVKLENISENSNKRAAEYDNELSEAEITEENNLLEKVEKDNTGTEVSLQKNTKSSNSIPGSITEAIMAPMFTDTGRLQELIIKDGKYAAKENTEEIISSKDTVERNVNVEAEENSRRVETIQAATASEAIEAVKATNVENTGFVQEAGTKPQEQIHSHNLSDTSVIRIVEAAKEPISTMIREQVAEAVESAIKKEERPSIREVMQGKTDLSKVNPPDRMGHLLSQEYDGQIRMVVPDDEKVEKQITGQMNLEDILAEWERTKKENEEKRKKETEQRLLQQTGTMFTEFEAKVRDGILEKLEQEEGLAKPVTEETKKPEKEEKQKGEELEVLPGAEELAAISEIMASLNSKMNSVFDSDDSVEELEEVEEVTTASVEDVEEKPGQSDSDIEELEEMDNSEEETEEEKTQNTMYKEPVRNMSEEEISLFAPFVQTKGARIRLIQSLDQISLAAYTGNVFVTGETVEEAVELAKSVVKEVQMTDRNFSGKVAKVTGFSLNNRDISGMVSKLANGALIVEAASGMDAQTTKDLLKALNQEKTGIVVVLQDNKKSMNKMMEYFPGMKDVFNVHIEVEELGDDALVAYGRKYARYLEYAIDELGVLALHTRIEEMQTLDHIVTAADVRDIVDEAIEHANRKNLRHFTDILLAKRYDDDDMIILRERDFIE